MRFRLLFLAGLIVALGVGPAQAQSSADARSRLQSEIARIGSASKGMIGVAAIHLPSGRRVEHNGDQPFRMASTLKLPLAAFALHLGGQGKIPLTEPLATNREQLIEPGILNEHFPYPGLAISTLNAINLSVSVSDNGATDIVYARVGGPVAVQSWLRSIGLTGIDMGKQTVAQTFAAGDSDPSGKSARTSTPAAMAELLARLHRGRLLGAEQTATLLEIMERTQGERLSLHLPKDVKVRHKTGTLFSATGLHVNDVGLIALPNGEALAIAVFIKDSPESVPHATRDRVIGGIARAIFDFFLVTG